MASFSNADSQDSEPPVQYNFPVDCTAEFVGEGRANAVFKVHLPESYKRGNSDFMKGKLLRVAKHTETDSYSPVALQDFWQGVIRSLFDPSELVQQSLVRLEGSGILMKLARTLDESGHREARFRGTRLNTDAKLGMLVEDMSEDLVLEFKPKWLSQSLSAPAGAGRCRNCANEEQKYEKTHASKSRDGKVLCPLDLLHCKSEPRTLKMVVRSLPIKSGVSDVRQQRLVQWLQETHLFERLAEKQLEKDRVGPLAATSDVLRAEDVDDLALAMTLRDCSCYIKIPTNANEPLQAKLADLDRKNAKDGKLDYWRKTEEELREFYLAEVKPARVTKCRIERNAGHNAR